jgi:glycosyltransferase involved in cell wall biosynthesis
MKNKNVAFTITAKNRLPSAIVCRDTFLQHTQKADFFIFLADMVENKSELSLMNSSEPIGFYGLKILPQFRYSNKLEEMAFKYNLVEFNTAVKPFIIEYLFNYLDYNKILYFDSDIMFYTACTELYADLNKYSVILTPHILTPYPQDDKLLTDKAFIAAGLYNLGFIGLSKQQDTLDFVHWWEDKLADYCIHNIQENYFVDQSWAALATCFCNTKIIKSPAYNVASWNLHERNLKYTEVGWLVNDRPLVFYHFSGLDYNNPDIISVYQNRYRLSNRPELVPLYNDYLTKLKDYNAFNHITLPYAFNTQGNTNPVNKGNYGINVVGYFPHVGGIMETARLFTRKLYNTGLQLALNPLQCTGLPLLSDVEEYEFKSLYAQPKFDTTLYFINLDEALNVCKHFPNLFNAKRKIVIPWWEVKDICPIGHENLNMFDAVIVFTDFVKEALNLGDKKVYKLPYPFVPLHYINNFNKDVAKCRAILNISIDEYVFLYNFDYISGLARKNPVGVIEAFSRAFYPEDNVKLIIKSINANDNSIEEYISRSRMSDKIILIDNNMGRSDMLSLLNLCDCYVSLHRSEGLGMGLFEAMSLGKYCIATNYGGNLEFMNNSNSLLVDYKMVPTPANDRYYAGGSWAEPNLDHAADFMYNLYSENFRYNPKAQRSIEVYTDVINFNKQFYEILLDE